MKVNTQIILYKHSFALISRNFQLESCAKKVINMAIMFKLTSFILFIGVVKASCPNSCSGHGTCGVDDVVSSFRSFHLSLIRCDIAFIIHDRRASLN